MQIEVKLEAGLIFGEFLKGFHLNAPLLLGIPE
jgi:hypothetical protein